MYDIGVDMGVDMDQIQRIESKLDNLATSIMAKLSEIERDVAKITASREGDLSRLARAEHDVMDAKSEVRKLSAEIAAIREWRAKVTGYAIGAGILAGGAGSGVVAMLGGGA
jgi:predicted  nucleic acid-binding Zn-ribbon protein